VRAERVHRLPEILAVLLCHVVLREPADTGLDFLSVGPKGLDGIELRARIPVDAKKSSDARGDASERMTALIGVRMGMEVRARATATTA